MYAIRSYYAEAAGRQDIFRGANRDLPAEVVSGVDRVEYRTQV